MARCCAVTGAGGYVGSRLVQKLTALGWTVRPLRREQFSLEGGLAPGALDGLDALVHCAWDFGAAGAAEIKRVNVDGSRRLLDAAAERRVGRLVFVSTLSAFPGCRSLYGRAKLAVEDHAQELGAAVVRPGLVWGEHPAGLYGALARAAGLPVTPVVTGARSLYLAHEDDVAQELAHAADQPGDGTPVAAAADEPLTLADLLGRVAWSRGRRLRPLPVPWRVPWAALRALEAARLRPPFRSDSLVSLVSLDEQPFTHAARPYREFRRFAP